METLTVAPQNQPRDRFECAGGWYRLVLHGNPSDSPPELFGLHGNRAGYRFARYQTSSGRFHYALYRGAGFVEEAGTDPSDELLERAAFWNDCLLVSFDPEIASWHILSNRAASIPVFWTRADGRTIVSNNLVWLGGGSGQIDPVAFAETLLWDVPLGDRTLRRAIHQLPAGYMLRISPSGALTQRRFVLNIRPSAVDGVNAPLGELVEHGASLNLRAVHRAISADLPLILPISGGLDSRCILGAVPAELIGGCSTISFGHPGAFELAFGRNVARQCGASWKEYELDSAHYTESQLPKSVRAGCGMTPLQHLHLSTALGRFPKGQSQVLIGYMGDPVAGADAEEKCSAASADEAVAAMFAKAGMTQHAAVKFFGTQTAEGIVDDLQRIYRDAISENPAEAFLEYYFIVERQSKLVTHIFNHLHWSGHCLGFPFMDGVWARFFLSLPPALRANRALFQKSLCAQRPDLARIPSTAGFAPFTASAFSRRSAGFAAKYWNRACTASQRLSGYRFSLPNPFATELQGVVLRGPLHDQLLQSVEKLRTADLLSAPLADLLTSQKSLHRPWIGFRAISTAHCLEEETT